MTNTDALIALGNFRDVLTNLVQQTEEDCPDVCRSKHLTQALVDAYDLLEQFPDDLNS